MYLLRKMLNMEEEITKSDNTEKKQIPNRIPDEKGRMIFPPGVSGNPAGRPKGSISIKAAIKKRLEENPEELKEIVEHFVKKNRELMWQMIEGRPSQQVDLGNVDELPFMIKIHSPKKCPPYLAQFKTAK